MYNKVKAMSFGPCIKRFIFDSSHDESTFRENNLSTGCGTFREKDKQENEAHLKQKKQQHYGQAGCKLEALMQWLEEIVPDIL